MVLRITVAICIASLSAFLIASGMAQPQSSNDRVIAALNASANVRVSWDFSKAKVADVTCDGKPDRVIFGLSAGKVWMGMLPGGSGKPQVMEFRHSSGDQAALCARPKRIEVYPLACSTEAVGELPGCQLIKSCRAFSIRDDECDSLNFYWDNSRKMLSWWRA